MKGALRLSRAIDTLIEWLGGLSMLLVTLLLGVGIYNVVVRYIGRFTRQNLASNTLLEAQWYLFSLIFFLGFAFILKRNTHVRVDFLYQNFGPKARAWVNLLGTLLFLFPFCLIGIYVTYEPVLSSWGLRPNGTWGTWEMSPDAGGLPRAPLKSMIIVAFVLLIVQGVSEIIKHVAVLRGVKSADEETYEQLEVG
jgi:TRAP-type mannitol/chloroaromatic compound transport system permease small subunit